MHPFLIVKLYIPLYSCLYFFHIGLGYTVVVSWTLRFLVGAITGSAFTAFASDQHFDLITRSNASLWIIVTLFISGFTMVGGIEKGIEKVNKIMMTAFLAFHFASLLLI